jgi:fluoride exporter
MNWDMLTVIACVAIGGAIGATMRYLVGHYVGTSTFPWGTFLVNIIGCTLLALLTFSVSGQMSANMKFFVFTGIFGGFTTMSTFTVETVSLFYDDQMLKALENILLNGGGCLLGAFIGRYLALLI